MNEVHHLGTVLTNAIDNPPPHKVDKPVAPETKRVMGTVKLYMSRKGYGFINTPGEPKDVFVHWKDLDTKKGVGYPSLKRGQKVTMKVELRNGNRVAVEVRDEDGAPLASDATRPESDWKREFASKNVYTGIIKFFNHVKGYGYLKHDGITTEDGTKVTEDLFFHSKDVLTSNGRYTSIPKGAAVEFQLYKDDKGYGAARCYVNAAPYSYGRGGFYSGRQPAWNQLFNRRGRREKKESVSGAANNATAGGGGGGGKGGAGFSLHGLSPDQVKIKILSDKLLQIELQPNTDFSWSHTQGSSRTADLVPISKEKDEEDAKLGESEGLA